MNENDTPARAISRRQLRPLAPEAESPKRQNHHEATDGPVFSTGSRLCAECGELDLKSMLSHETLEQDMGLLSDHLCKECPLCRLISEGLLHHWGAGWSSTRLCSESDPIPKVFVQSRSPVTVKEHGHVEYPEPRLLLALNTTPPGFNENRRVIREVDRVKDRHIIAEIEVINGQDSGPQARPSALVPRREVAAAVNTGLVKDWLRECREHEHTRKAHEQMGKDSIDKGFFNSREGFRLVDVEDECLVLKTEPCPFAALSYVWGKLPTVLRPRAESTELPVLLTTKDNLESLSTPGGLSCDSLRKQKDVQLPQTVVDAMEFSRRIGMRYLWIDTLCIVQDDRGDKSFLIQAMDNVYDIAAVTYIAASGKNANAGLRGVSFRHGRPIEATTIVDDGAVFHLCLCPPSLGEEVRNSVWNTRGWTFQEQALSQRCLYFTEDEVFFNCIEYQRREAYALELADQRSDLKMRTGPPWWNRKLRKDPDPTPYRYLGDLTGTLTIKDYEAAVQDYSRKTLSFPEDVLTAFEGVFNRFSKCAMTKELSMEQTQGIPANHLHRAMLWFPSEESVRRRCEESPQSRFASWSWASWDGPIEFVFADSMWLSRNISQVPLKKVPVHVLIPCWHYGGTAKKFYSQDIWRAVCETPGKIEGEVAKSWATAKVYAQGKTGVNMDVLLNRGAHGEPPELEVGDLGFWAAYIDSCDVVLESKTGGGQVCRLEIGPHRGEFRFDEADSGASCAEVTEYVVVVTSDTITKVPDTQSIFLGLATKSGVSHRVGVGWVYYSKTEGASCPQWKYKLFKIA